MNELKHQELTSEIIKAYYSVYNELGRGFLEKVYRNALHHLLLKSGLHVEREYPISVLFDGIVVGEFFADLFVEQIVIVEIKAVEQLVAKHDAQLLNYLKATGVEVGLLLNFGNNEPEFRRKVLTRKSTNRSH